MPRSRRLISVSHLLASIHRGTILTSFPERLEEWIGVLSTLSSITLRILLTKNHWLSHDDTESIIEYIRCGTKILERFRGRKNLRDARVQFELPSISALGCPLSRGGSSLEACAALEELLLAFPASNVQFQYSQHRAGRREFWYPVVKSAFPQLNAQGRLILPKSR